MGIGVGECEGNEFYGVEWIKLVVWFEEVLVIICVLWNLNGEFILCELLYFLLYNVLFDFLLYCGKWFEIWVVVYGLWMLWVIGCYVDVWIFIVVVCFSDYSCVFEVVCSVVFDVGCDLMLIILVVVCGIIIGWNCDDVEEVLEFVVVKMIVFGVFGEVWVCYGVEYLMGVDFFGV